MLSSIQVTSGFAADLPALKGRKFAFREGLNVLFGPNACGKTSLCRILGAYTGQNHGSRGFGGGWSETPKWLSFDGTNPNYPDDFSENAPGKCKADVEWDGVPCFYNSASLSDSISHSSIAWDAKEAPDGLETSCGANYVSMLFANPSEGQLRISKIRDVFETMKKPPEWPPKKNKYTSAATEVFIDYLETKPCKGRMTLIWDEPDRSLDVPNQIAMWTNFLPQVGANCQVICATHSFVPLLLTSAPFLNIIDVQEGYLAKAKSELLGVFDLHKLLEEKTKNDNATKEVPPSSDSNGGNANSGDKPLAKKSRRKKSD